MVLVKYAFNFALLGGVKRPISLCGNIPAHKLMYVDVPIRCLYLSIDEIASHLLAKG